MQRSFVSAFFTMHYEHFCFILTQMRKFLPKIDYCKVVRTLNMRDLSLNFFRESIGLNLIILLVR